MLKFYWVLCCLFISTCIFSQLSNFKMLVGKTESEIKAATSSYITKEGYTSEGKMVVCTYNGYNVIYILKSDKKCYTMYISFTNSQGAYEMYQWLYDNGYEKMKTKASSVEKWEKNYATKYSENGIPLDLLMVEAMKVGNTSFEFAEFKSKYNLNF